MTKKTVTLETTEERRLKKIAQLQARIEKEKALLNTAKRKERTGQLISAGVLLETIYKTGDAETRKKIEDQAAKHITDDRNLARLTAMFKRLDNETTQV